MYEQLSFIDTSCPKMPQEYIGKYLKHTELTVYTPREWTDKEIEWCLNLRERGYSAQEIAESVGREKTSVAIKLKRLTKSTNTYNVEHLKEKYNTNDAFFNLLKPQSILDVYSGEACYWSKKSGGGG